MKTQIIQLERHDDIISTRDKMMWAKAKRIILVWPDRGRILSRRLDLLLLQRHSQSLGSQLGLVTKDWDIIGHARDLGLPVFPSVKKAQTGRWRRLRGKAKSIERQTPRQDYRSNRPDMLWSWEPTWAAHPFGRVSIFMLGILAVFALLAYLVPSASLRIHPQPQTLTLQFPITADESIQQVNLAGQIPLEWSTVQVEAQYSGPATGRASVPQQAATGTVQFTNLSVETVEIPAGTAVLAVGEPVQRYLTTRAGRLAAQAGATVDLPVRAELPGSVGNQAVGAIRAVEGPLGLRLSVTNTQRIQGGTDRSAVAPSQQDYRQAWDSLLKELASLAEQDLATRMGTLAQPVAGSARLMKILTENMAPAINVPADQYTLTIQAQYEVAMVAQADLRGLILSTLETRLPEGSAAIADSLTWTQTAISATDNDSLVSAAEDRNRPNLYRWEIAAELQYIPVIDPQQVVNWVVGQDRAQAQQILADRLNLAEPPQLQIQPAWWPRLPFLPFRIEVQVDAGGAQSDANSGR